MINEKEAFLTHALSRNRTAHVKQSNCLSEIAFASHEVQNDASHEKQAE